MIRRKKENIEWLEFEQLQEFPEIIHGIFLRHGGDSPPPFDSLNVGGGSGDQFSAVKQNRKKILNLLGISELVSSLQVHGDRVVTVPIEQQILDAGCDGLITTKRNIGLLIKHADCQAAIFYDPKHKVVGNVHCGWRGNVKNIYGKAIAEMKQRFTSKPEDILVCISPSLGPEKAEFINYQNELPKEFLPFQVSPTYFDLWGIAKMQLQSAGILEHHIEIAEICTYLEEKDFFSFRREKKTGRHGTVVALKPI